MQKPNPEKRQSSIYEIVEELNQTCKVSGVQDSSVSNTDIKPNAIENNPYIDRELEEYQKVQNEEYVYNITQSNSGGKYSKSKIYGILVLQLILSSLRAPLYLTIHSQPIIRTAWRQGFTAAIYIPISIYEAISSQNYNIDFTNKYLDLLLASVAQAIFAASLSIAVTNTHVSFALMFYNSSLLVYCGYKILFKLKSQVIEYCGFALSFMLLIFIIFNHSFVYYAKKDVSSFREIVLGDLTALFGGSVSTFIYAKYYQRLEFCCPKFTLFAIIRFLSTVILLVTAYLFETNFKFLDFLEPILFMELFFNALFTGVLMNYLQSKIENLLDPLSFSSANFFQPLIGSVSSFLLGYESLPSLFTLLQMILFSVGLILIQIGRTTSEVEDVAMESVEMIKLDTIVFDSVQLLSKLETIKEEPKSDRYTIYGKKKKTLVRQNRKTFIDFSMDK